MRETLSLVSVGVNRISMHGTVNAVVNDDAPLDRRRPQEPGRAVTAGYSRFEVRYRIPRRGPGIGVPLAVQSHVWGWASDRKQLDKLLAELAANPQLEHVETIDRERITKLDGAADRHVEPARAGLLL